MSVKAKKFVTEKGYYEILEVSPLATTNEIQRSFERLCDEYVNLKDEDPQTRKSSAETLYTLTKAYEVLTDPFQRMSYDERRFGAKQNNNNEVETIFKEGIKASRASNTQGAVRFFKETVDLFPHRPVYRVNLAIASHEAGDIQETVRQLRMALMLDPTNEFAQEVVAKLLFGVSDKKGIGFFVSKANRQLTALIAGSIILIGILGFGVPKLMALYGKWTSAETETERIKRYEALKAKMPADLRKAIDESKSNPTSYSNNTGAKNSSFKANIAKLDDNFKPDGKVSDYSSQKAVRKTYYKDQDMIVIDCDNGSILTYKTQDVIGWKKDPEKGIPLIITKANEIIPVQTDIPVTLPNGKTVESTDPDFPASAFPEYEVKEVPKQENSNNSNSIQNNNVSQPVEVQPVQNQQVQQPVQEAPKVPEFSAPVDNNVKAPVPPPPPPVGINNSSKGNN